MRTRSHELRPQPAVSIAACQASRRWWCVPAFVGVTLWACSGDNGQASQAATTGDASMTGAGPTTGSGGTTAATRARAGSEAAPKGGERSAAGVGGGAGHVGPAVAGSTATAGSAGAAGQIPMVGGMATSMGGAGAAGTPVGVSGAGAAGAAGSHAAAGSGGMGSAERDTSCLIPTLNPQAPPKALKLSGNLGTHDPAVIFADGTYYLFATGNGIAAKTSTDLRHWTAQPDVFSRIPGWVPGRVSGVTNIWAPDISFFGGLYHLYYAVSSFGSNRSCIGHATREHMGTGSWNDHGAVICSNVGSNDDWNAIDPNVVVDEAGRPWMSFGSFWSGIKLIKLDDSGQRADDKVLSIAKHSSIEGPFIVHQCGYYYLFVSFGACCNGKFDYNVRVGRSKSVTGPYVDKHGTDMLDGGGNQIVKGNSTWTAPGHNAILVTPDGTYNFYHALNASHANPTLRIAELVLDADGWPVSGGP